jgi:hypothetical protein
MASGTTLDCYNVYLKQVSFSNVSFHPDAKNPNDWIKSYMMIRPQYRTKL